MSPPHARWPRVAEWSARSRARTVQVSLLILAVTTAGIALVAFLLDLIVNDPVSVAAMLVIVILAVMLDLSWKRLRPRRELASNPARTITEDAGGNTSPSRTSGSASTTTP